MSWKFEISRKAVKQLSLLPRTRQVQLYGQLELMAEDPLGANVLALKGSWKGFYRKRVGRYRIIFSLHKESHSIEVYAILHRDDQTYRS